MAKKLEGKVAIVTGASKGIGAEIAKQFAAEGASVVVNYASSKSGADAVVTEITKKGGKAVAVQGDVAKQADVEKLLAETTKAFGRLDVLVNNAGIYEFSPIENVTPEHYRKLFDINVLGLLSASREAAKHFGKDGGSIINISSARQPDGRAERLCLQRHQGRGGCHHEVPLERTRSAQDPRQFHQSRNGHHRRSEDGRIRGQRLPEGHSYQDSARAHRTAGRHRAGGSVLRFERFLVDYRRDARNRRRLAVKQTAVSIIKEAPHKNAAPLFVLN